MSCLCPHHVHISLLVYENHSTTSFQLLLAACDATAGWAGVSYMPFLTPRGEDGATWGSLIDRTIYFSLLLHNKRQAFMSWAKNSSRSIFELMGSFSKSSTRGFSAPARGIKSCWFDRNRCFSLTELFIMLLSLKMVLSLGRYHNS